MQTLYRQVIGVAALIGAVSCGPAVAQNLSFDKEVFNGEITYIGDDFFEVFLAEDELLVGDFTFSGNPRQNCQDKAYRKYVACQKAAGKDVEQRKLCVAEFKVEKEFCLERY